MELSSLTQEQQWGLAYRCQRENENIVARSAMIVQQNERITAENENLIVKKPLIPVQSAMTVEQYVTKRLAEMGDQGYNEIMAIKIESAKTKILALPQEQLAALLTQFEIPDVLQS